MAVSKKSTFKQKAGDVILIAAITAVVIVSIPLASSQNAKAGPAFAVVEVNGIETLRLALGKNQSTRKFIIDGFAGKSTIEVVDGKVRMQESTCPDKLCIGMGWADKTGDSIICVPNRVVIRLIGPAGNKNVDTVTE